MKKFSTRTMLRVACWSWGVATIIAWLFKDAESTQRTAIIWMLFTVASIIYNKLDDMEKKYDNIS